MLVKTLSSYDLMQLMIRCDRDYFTSEGYGAIIDYFDEFQENVEVDPIAISCEFTEDSILNVWDMYSHLFEDFPKPDVDSDYFFEWTNAFVEALNYYCWAVLLDNGDILFTTF